MADETVTFDSVLEHVKNGDISSIAGLVANPADEILSVVGPGNYDELFNAAIDSGNVDMVKVLLGRSNLIQMPLKSLIDVSEGDSLKGVPNAEQIRALVKDFLNRANRSNKQDRDWGRWRDDLEMAQENGYKDLADRIQRRMDFEDAQRLEGDGKLPEGTSENRWYLDDKNWVMDGYGRLEYDLYGQKNGQAILDELKAAGIRADFSAYIKNEKTGDLNDYRICVDENDVKKLREFLDKKCGKDIEKTKENEEQVEDKVEKPKEPENKTVPSWMGMAMPQFNEEGKMRDETPPQQVAEDKVVEPPKKDVLTPEERAVVDKYYQVGTYNDLTPSEQKIWRGLGPKVEQAKTPQEVFDIIGVEYKLKKEGTIRVDGSVPLGHLDLKKLPDLSNVIVGGNFSCRDNMITDLTGVPRLIEGAFLAEGNPPMSENRPFVAKKGIFFAPKETERQTDHDETKINKEGEEEMARKTAKLKVADVSEMNEATKEFLELDWKDLTEEKIQDLARRGADFNYQDENGRTKLYKGITNKANLKAIETLLQNGAKVNLQDKDGRSLIFGATLNNNYEMAQMLADNGANFLLQTKDGASPWDLVADGDTKPELRKLVLRMTREQKEAVAKKEAATHGAEETVADEIQLEEEKMAKKKTTVTDDMIFADPDLEGADAGASPRQEGDNEMPKKKTTKLNLDPAGNEIRQFFDDNGRVVREDHYSPNGRLVSRDGYYYDENGAMILRTDRKFEYDDRGNVSSTTWDRYNIVDGKETLSTMTVVESQYDESGKHVGNHEENFFYQDGKLVRRQSKEESYNSSGQLINEKSRIYSFKEDGEEVLDYLNAFKNKYDDNGNLVEQEGISKFPESDGKLVTSHSHFNWQYDSKGRKIGREERNVRKVEGKEERTSQIFSWEYDDDDRLIKEEFVKNNRFKRVVEFNADGSVKSSSSYTSEDGKTWVEEVDTTERDDVPKKKVLVPDLNKLAIMRNNFEANAIMKEDVPGFAETATMTPAELARNPKARFFNEVREAYSKAGTPKGLNDLVTTDQEAQWAEQLANAVEYDNSLDVPRIEKTLIITGTEKTVDPNEIAETTGKDDDVPPKTEENDGGPKKKTKLRVTDPKDDETSKDDDVEETDGGPKKKTKLRVTDPEEKTGDSSKGKKVADLPKRMDPTPGWKRNWEIGPSWFTHMTHPVKGSFHGSGIRPFYFNPKNLSPEEQELAMRMLTARGIRPVIAQAPDDMEKTRNPVQMGEVVWIVGGEYDEDGREIPYDERKNQIKRLKTFWKACERNEKMAFGLDLLDEDKKSKKSDSHSNVDEDSIADGADKRPSRPKRAWDEGARGEAARAAAAAGEFAWDQIKDVALPGLDALEKFGQTWAKAATDSPEKFGSEILIGMMVLPWDFIVAYTARKAGKVDLSKGGKDGSSKDPSGKADQAQALCEFMKKMIDKDPALFEEMGKKGLWGPETQKASQDERVQAAKQFFANNPELFGRLKKCFGQTAAENPQLFLNIVPPDYKGPITPDALLGHVMGWGKADIGNLGHQGLDQTIIPPKTPQVQGQPSELAQVAAVMQDLQAQVAALRSQVESMRAELAQERQKYAQLSEAYARATAENAQLRAQQEALLAQLQGKVISGQQTVQQVPPVVGPSIAGNGGAQPPVTPTTEVQPPKMEEGLVPDLDKLGSLNMRNNFEAKAIMDEDVPGFAESATMTPEELAQNPKAQFFNAVRQAYSKSDTPKGLNDLVRTDQEAQWAEQLASAVEYDNALNVPRIKKSLIITGTEKPIDPKGPTQTTEKTGGDVPPGGGTPPTTGAAKPEEKGPSTSTGNEDLVARMEAMQKEINRLKRQKNPKGKSDDRALECLEKIVTACISGKLVEVNITNIVDLLPSEMQKKLSEKVDKLNKDVKTHEEKKTKLTEQQERLRGKKGKEIFGNFELREGNVVLKNNVDVKVTNKVVAETLGYKRSEVATVENITAILQAGNEKGKEEAAKRSDYHEKKVVDRDPMTEAELVYLETNPLLAHYKIGPKAKNFTDTVTGERITPEALIESITPISGPYSDYKKHSTEFSTPDKIVAVMRKLERHPDLAAVYRAGNTAKLPRNTEEMKRAQEPRLSWGRNNGR